MSKREFVFQLLTWTSVVGVIVLVAMAALWIVFLCDRPKR